MWNMKFAPDAQLTGSSHQAMKALMLKSGSAVTAIPCRHDGVPCRFCGFRPQKTGTLRKADMVRVAESVDRAVGES